MTELFLLRSDHFSNINKAMSNCSCGENIKYDECNLIFGVRVSSRKFYTKVWSGLLVCASEKGLSYVECLLVKFIQDPGCIPTFHIHIDIHFLRELQTEPRGCFRFQRCLLWSQTVAGSVVAEGVVAV